MRVSELGEFGLIERIAKSLPSPSSDVIVGIGDDVAVLDVSGPEYLLATCDTQIQNVHFLLDFISPYQLGRKIAAINLSDIAATGGIPAWALVSLALPGDTDVSFTDDLYRGMREEMQLANACIVGGNMSRIRAEIVIDLFLLGRVAPEHMVLRNGAREGDLIMATGTLGDSRAGLELIRRPDLIVSDEHRRYVVGRHLTPHPRLTEGRMLGSLGLVHSMADVSDGIVSDIRHICNASRVGAEILAADAPVSEACIAVAHAAGCDALDWALTGGEDYELLFTVAPEFGNDVCDRLKSGAGSDCRVIGRIVPHGDGIHVIFPDGRKVSYGARPAGWDHFSDSPK